MWSWDTQPGSRVETQGIETSLVESVRNHLRTTLNIRNPGETIDVRCARPPSRGLKTSSSVAAALVQAGTRAAGKEPSWDQVAAAAVATSREAGVAVTGAFDDQVATIRGGCHLTDNRNCKILQTIIVPAWHVAIWVPTAAIAKSQVRALDARPIAVQARAVERLVRAGNIPAAITANGSLFHGLYQQHGLPVSDAPTQAALAAGALGAGLSGTGPAVAAIFERPGPIADVPGGSWEWTRVALEAA